jgi:hypothetical protein
MSPTSASAVITTDQPFIAEKTDDHEEQGPTGCYLVYEPVAGGRLMLHYSQGYVPDNAVGFWCPGPDHEMQGFKFKQAGGQSELINGIAGGDANRRKYFIGWCQFLKQCKAMQGKVIQFTNIEQGVLVDVYAYNQATNHSYLLDLSNQLTDISNFDAEIWRGRVRL